MKNELFQFDLLNEKSREKAVNELKGNAMTWHLKTLEGKINSVTRYIHNKAYSNIIPRECGYEQVKETIKKLEKLRAECLEELDKKIEDIVREYVYTNNKKGDGKDIQFFVDGTPVSLDKKFVKDYIWGDIKENIETLWKMS